MAVSIAQPDYVQATVYRLRFIESPSWFLTSNIIAMLLVVTVVVLSVIRKFV
jgi:hypothetical protein